MHLATISGMSDRTPVKHPGRDRLRSPLVLPEWIEAGLLGGGTVAAVFLFRDWLLGEPLHTPSVLGVLLFQGVEAARATTSASGAAVVYTAIHFGMWIAVGLAAAQVMRRAEDEPKLWWLPVASLALALLCLLALDVWVGETGLTRPYLWLGGVAGLAALGGFLCWRHPGALRLPGRRARAHQHER
jgi:ABC-type Fe3+-siderophore transport system permease subunit